MENKTFPIEPYTKRLAFQFHITLAMAVSVLRSVVAEFGAEYVYEGSCVYVDAQSDGTLTAKCIVGQAFSRWGILRSLVASRETLVDNNLSSGNALDSVPGDVCNLAGFDVAARRYLASIGITMDDDAHTFLRRTQSNQDTRVPWGDSVTEAAEYILTERGQTVGDPLDRILM